MRGFRDIKEVQRPGNSKKEVRFSDEALKIYNALFADDFSAKATLEQATKDCIETTSNVLSTAGGK